LNKLKVKAVLTEAVSLNPIDPALLHVDVVPLVPKLRKNRTTHTDYIRHTQEEAATLREIVESERLLSPLNTSLAYACKYTRRIQELLIILQQTGPSITDLGTKLVAVTPKNKTKQIRHTAQITKSERTTVATSPSANIDSNTPVLSSTGVTLSVEVSDLNVSLQKKVLVIAALKEQLNTLKGKAYTRRIQELLMILQQTCPNITDLETTLVAVTPKNKTKQIRRTARITKSERTTIATSPSANIDSNTPVLSSTGVTLVSSASGSKSQDNTKKNRIRRTQKKAKETKLGDHLRTVKSSLNKASIVDSTATSSVRLNVPVRRIRTDNGTEFVNQTLRDYYEEVGISHETSVAPSPQQNGVVERHNRTLIEAARTMLIYAQ
nr:putative ribonuclease H-like domain-containing protein [Tanacetum cinerariifolium]